MEIDPGRPEPGPSRWPRAGEPLGIEVDSAVFDQVRTCDNHCSFCFIYQLPKGMRRSLYLKDDDYRLSFLYGNFTTLTRFTEADLERVVTEGLSPLYVSIHATDPTRRSELLRNRRGATSLRWLRALLDHGVEVHGQVVVCPGVNDGEILADTLLGVLDQYPELASPRRRARSGSATTRTSPTCGPTPGPRPRPWSTWWPSGRGSTSTRWATGWSTPPTSTTCWPGDRSRRPRSTATSRCTRTGSGWPEPSSASSPARRPWPTGGFWRYHPTRAWAWELRLQDEIGPDFRIEEAPYDPPGLASGPTHDPGHEAHRAAYLRDHPEEALAAVEKEALRRRGRGKDTKVLPEMQLLEPGLWSALREQCWALETTMIEKQEAAFRLVAPDEPTARQELLASKPELAEARNALLAKLASTQLKLDGSDS